MEIPIAPEGILYDSRRLNYFEVFGTVNVPLFGDNSAS